MGQVYNKPIPKAEDKVMPKLPDAPLHYRLFVLTVWQGEQDSPGEPGPWRFSLADPRTGGRRGFRSLDQLKRYLDD